MNALVDVHEHNPDPTNAGCVITGNHERGVSFRGFSLANLNSDFLFLGETVLHEAIAELYEITVDEVKDWLSKSGDREKAALKDTRAELRKVKKQLEQWNGFKEAAEAAGISIREF